MGPAGTCSERVRFWGLARFKLVCEGKPTRSQPGWVPLFCRQNQIDAFQLQCMPTNAANGAKDAVS